MEVIPAIDLRDGRVVRLEQGDYARETVYDPDPAAVASRFVEQGAERLHVVDLDAAREGTPRNWSAVEAILRRAEKVPLQLGGGLRSLEQIEAALGLGVDRVILGTVALESPELLIQAAGRFPERVILALDARDGRVAVHGWLDTAELRVEDVLDRFVELPLAAILHTDIARDGTLAGPNLEATVQLAGLTQHPVLASGGVSSLGDLTALAHTQVIAGTIVGRALYTGAIDLAAALREVRRC